MNFFLSNFLQKRKLAVYIIGVVLLIVLFLLVVLYNHGNIIENTPPKILRLAISKSFLSIPIYVAMKQDYFKKEGINVKVTEYSSGKLALDSMFNDTADICTVADMPVVINSFERDDFCIIATFTYSYDMVKIVARTDKGIQIPKDLVGKRVGVNPGTSSHFYLSSFLIFNRIPISKLKLINMKTVDMPESLINEQVEAASVWEPYASKAMNLLKNNGIVLKAPDIYRTTFSFAAKKQYVTDNQDAIIKLIKSIDKAIKFIHRKRDLSVEIISSVFNIDKEIVNNELDKFVFGIFLDESLLISWDSIARWEIENSFVKERVIPNYLNYVCLDLLEKIMPEVVTIIH